MSASPPCASSQWRSRCAGRQATVQRDDAPAREPLDETGDELWREIDLRNEHQCLAIECECRGRGTQVDLGLAAAGAAVQQHRARDRGGKSRDDALMRRRLFRRQLRRGRDRRGVRHPDDVLFRASDALGDAHILESAQFGREHRQGDLADTALVVRRGESGELAPGRRKRRQRVAEFDDRPNLARVAFHDAVAPDDSRHFATAQGHANQASGRERALAEIRQGRAQAGVQRCVDGDRQRNPTHAHREPDTRRPRA